MRIETHAHSPVFDQLPAPSTFISKLVKEYEKRGIDKILLIQSEEWGVFDFHAQCPDFIIPCPRVDIDTAQPDDISRLVDRGAKGIKFIGPMRSYGDDFYMPLYERLDELGVTAVFHTGYLMVGLYEKGGKHGEKPSLLDITDMRPAAIDRIVRGFPNLKILMAHFGNPWWEEAWKMIASHQNVYADLSGGTAIFRSMSMWSEMFAPNGSLAVNSTGKLCFASDCSYFVEDHYNFEQFIDFYERLFEKLGVKGELRERVNSGNALELFAE